MSDDAAFFDDSDSPVELLRQCTRLASGIPYKRIDHIALAVSDLNGAIYLFEGILGFELKKRREIRGTKTGMISAEMEISGIRFVLCQGTEPESQVSQLVQNYGVGVAHIALEVDDIEEVVSLLIKRGMQFDTEIIRGPGLIQAFTTRSIITGISFELIKREGEEGFLESNVQALFDQLERGKKY